LFQLALVVSPEMWKFSAALITEAPATAAVALWCALLMRMILKPSARGVGALAVISSLAVLVKPSLVAMFLGTAIVALLLHTAKERNWSLAMTAIAFVATLAITPISNLLLHGSAASGSPIARGVLQHTLFCPPARVPANADSAFVEQYSKIVRDYVSGAPSDVQPAIKRLYTGKLRFGLIIPTIGRRHGLQAGWETDELIWRIAKERVSANPGCYAKSVINSYLSLATYKSYSSSRAKQISTWLVAHPPVELPVERLLPRDEQMAEWAARDLGTHEPSLPGRQDLEAPTGRPLILVWAARALYGAAAVIGLAAMAFLFAGATPGSRDRKLVVSLAALGIIFHGVLGLTALVELHLTRYTVPIWPVVCTMLGIVAETTLDRSRSWAMTRRQRMTRAIG
jgi:hypothetical protein